MSLLVLIDEQLKKSNPSMQANSISFSISSFISGELITVFLIVICLFLAIVPLTNALHLISLLTISQTLN